MVFARAIIRSNSRLCSSHLGRHAAGWTGDNSGKTWLAVASAAAIALLNDEDDGKDGNTNNSAVKAMCDFDSDSYSSQPFQKVESSSMASLLHRYSKDESHQNTPTNDLHTKYNIDWNNVLGEGAYGKVYLARVAETGEKVALKKISKQFTNSSAFTSETAALWRIYETGGHPNISGLRGIYEDYSHFYVILDLARGGELFDHLIKDGAYSERDASRLISEILSALAFLHNIGVVHCDLKPENILLCDSRRGVETVKIIDFGCAKVDKRGDSPFQFNQANNPSRSFGTRAYWAPECFGVQGKKTDAMDIWAVGVVLFIMLCGVHPFDLKAKKTDKEIEAKIKKNPNPPIHLATHLSPSARDFIKQLMCPDPAERLTAITALQHPWIRGVTPKANIIDGSDIKLEMYQDLKNRLATGIFAALVDSDKLTEKKDADSSSLTHLLKRAFDVFDTTGKGFVTDADIGRVMAKVTGSKLSMEDEKDLGAAVKRSSSHKSSNGLSLSDFSQLFSQLSHEHYKQGDYLYHPGDDGDAMYFINSGKIEILTKKGHLLSILRHGDFFGEGAIIEDRTTRIAAARCATPVHVIKVSREDFNKYISSSPETKLSIKHKWKARALTQAKKLIRLQTNLTRKHLKAGDVVYREGDVGESMYVVDEGTGGTLEVRLGDQVLHRLKEGDSFGESSLLFQRPRSSTVVCTSSECHLHEMKSSDFYDLLEADPGTARALRELCRTRMFQRATKSYLMKQNNGLKNDDLVKAFRDADTDNSGSLNLDEVQNLFRNMGYNSEIPEEEVIEYFNSLNLDDDGQVTLEEFQRVFNVIQ